MPILELFRDSGIFIAVLAALSWVAYSGIKSVPDDTTRWVEALSQAWLMRSAILIAAVAWIWAFGRLFVGDAYLRGSGAFPDLSTLLLIVMIVVLVVAFLGTRSGTPLYPWLTYGLVLTLILLSGSLLLPAPKNVLSQDNPNEERDALDFVQKRLASLHCFEAAGVEEPTVVTFDTEMAFAVASFEKANGLVHEGRYPPGIVRPKVEFKRLAQPFPFLFGPDPCSVK